jgi:hypothetical protein
VEPDVAGAPLIHALKASQRPTVGASRCTGGGHHEEGEEEGGTDLRAGGGVEGRRPSGRPPYRQRRVQQAAMAPTSKRQRRRRRRVTGAGGGWGLATLTAHPLTSLYGPCPVGRLGPQKADTRPTGQHGLPTGRSIQAGLLLFQAQEVHVTPSNFHKVQFTSLNLQINHQAINYLHYQNYQFCIFTF